MDNSRKQGRNKGLLTSILEAIGETPLVELSRLTRRLEGRILAKLENLNPGYSKKDRIALQIIEDAISAGTLKSGQPVVEVTSGNTGTGLAIVCAIKRHPFVAVMSKGNSIERAKMMSALGAEVVLVDQLPGSLPGEVSGGDLALVEEASREIAEQRGAFRADQFRHQSNFLAHYLHTGPEILGQSNNAVDAFCDFVGTGGTFAGCAAAFKESDSSIQCFVVEPEEAALLSGEKVTNPNHSIQGGGYALSDLALLNPKHIDGFIKVSDEAAIAAARRLAKEEGIFAGFSTGANLAAALHLLENSVPGKTIAIVVCDSGLKYLSTKLWP